MSSAEKPLFDIGSVLVPPSVRLAAMHEANAQMAEENAERDRTEVPFIIARLATAAETTITASQELVPEDFDPPAAA